MRLSPGTSSNVIIVGPGPGQSGGVSSVMSNLQKAVNTDKYNLHFVNTLRSGRWSIVFFVLAILKTLNLLTRSAVTKQAVVVHLNVASRGSTYRKLVLSVICRTFSVPYVCHLHGARYRSFFDKSSPLVKRLIQSMFQASASVIVLGTPWRDHVIEDLGVASSKVAVVPNGTVEFSSRTSPPNSVHAKVRLIYSGRLEERKGLPELLLACDRLHQRGHKFELVLMGDTRDPQLLEEATRRPYSRVTGWLSKELVAREICSGDVFVLPSHDEGLPMAMLEAMSVGLPIVVTPVGGIPDVIVNGCEGFLVSVGEVNELAETLENLINSQALRNDLGTNARKRWNSDLTAECMTRRIEGLWQTSLRKPELVQKEYK